MTADSTTAPLDLEGLEYHASSSGTSTQPLVRQQILAACAEIRRLSARLAETERTRDAALDACQRRIAELMSEAGRLAALINTPRTDQGALP